ncbi:MAG: phosphoglycerate mutase family protein, partial [Planctomycetes bacterium]|nr:phosphoglycerate mutase family protein [Planctomycetota bacterium]
MQVYLVRHGQTIANTDESELSRQANHTIPLSEEGHIQSSAV